MAKSKSLKAKKRVAKPKKVEKLKVEEPKVEPVVELQELEQVASDAPVVLPPEPPKEVLPKGVLKKEVVLINGKECEKFWHSDGTTSIK